MKTEDLKVKAIVSETTEGQYETFDKGTMVEGYLNNWHLNERWTMQVECDCESGGISKGFYIIDVPIDTDTLEYASQSQQEGEFKNKQELPWSTNAMDYAKEFMKDREAFIRVYIKSEEDLPKEEGTFDTDKGIKGFVPGNDDDFTEWMTDIDWYLKPVSLQFPTKERIEEILWRWVNHKEGTTDFNISYNDASDIADDILSELTEGKQDEEIEQGAPFDEPGCFNPDEKKETEAKQDENLFVCPKCQSNDIFHFTQNHFKCRKCKEQWTD